MTFSFVFFFFEKPEMLISSRLKFLQFKILGYFFKLHTGFSGFCPAQFSKQMATDGPQLKHSSDHAIEDAFIGFLVFFLGVRSDEIEQVQVNQKFRARYENIACNDDVRTWRTLKTNIRIFKACRSLGVYLDISWRWVLSLVGLRVVLNVHLKIKAM